MPPEQTTIARVHDHDQGGTATKPLVSVVMTTYMDGPQRLRRAIDSILSQSLRALELIVVFEPERFQLRSRSARVQRLAVGARAL